MHGDARGRREGMNRIVSATVVAAAVGCIAFSAEAALRVEVGNVYEGRTDADGLSGITYAGGNSYYIVCDNGSRHGIYHATITLSADGKTITSYSISSTPVVPQGTTDNEDIAIDPSTGNVWVTDEGEMTVKEYNVTTGAEVQSLDVHTIKNRIMRRHRRGNNGLEALTMSGDGLTLWTCNEEALDVDGPNSSHEHPTTVRLVRYRRSTVNDKFQLASMHPYTTDTWTNPDGFAYNGTEWARCGVAGLCALPDDSLLVLERELSFDEDDILGKSVLGWKLYRIPFPCIATNVSNYPSLTNSTWTAERKVLLASNLGHFIPIDDFYLDDLPIVGNFEGICLGPKLADGGLSLLLVSDAGDEISTPQIQPLVLYGMDTHTLNVTKPFIGNPTIVGQNYRFPDGLFYIIGLRGEGIEPKAYTNRGDLVYSVSWSLPAHGMSGTGPFAMFNIRHDDTLIWNVSHMPSYANTPIYAHDTFEEYAEGTYGAVGRYWRGGGEVIEKTYTPSQGTDKYILKRAAHKKVLDAEDGAIRSLPMSQMSNISNHRMDLMVEIHRATEALPDTPDGNARIVIAADTDGTLKLWHRKGANGKLVATPVWSKIADTSFQNGDWVRVSVEIKNGSSMAFARVRVNGKGNMPNNSDWRSVPGGYSSAALNPGSGNGPWFPLRTIDPVSCLSLVGTKVDDFVLATPAYMTTLDSSASIMVSPVAQTSGANGAAAAGGHAYTVATAVSAPAIATANAEGHVAAPVITGFGIVPGGCPSIRFRGYAEGVGYRVVRSTSVDFKPANCEYPEGEITSVNGDEAIWEGAEPDDPSSGAKFYRVEAIAK